MSEEENKKKTVVFRNDCFFFEILRSRLLALVCRFINKGRLVFYF